jgi:hypothetical protein
MFKISFSNIFIMDANFAGLCEKVNNFSMNLFFASDRYLMAITAGLCGELCESPNGLWIIFSLNGTNAFSEAIFCPH